MTSSKLAKTVVLSVGIILAGANYAAYAGDYCPPDTAEKGNNGWGQEKRGLSDGTNNGSDNGATADTKTASTDR
jgi:hypothetical protein